VAVYSILPSDSTIEHSFYNFRCGNICHHNHHQETYKPNWQRLKTGDLPNVGKR